MTKNQKEELCLYLKLLLEQGYRLFHHGDAIGADAQAARIAKDLGYYLICHPGHPKDKTNTMYRAFTNFNDEVQESKPFIKRDRDIVDETDSMVATPVGEEEIRSGTWTTIRYAKKKRKEVKLIMPPFKPSR
jgi:deoxyribodipyrimidine photolyase